MVISTYTWSLAAQTHFVLHTEEHKGLASCQCQWCQVLTDDAGTPDGQLISYIWCLPTYILHQNQRCQLEPKIQSPANIRKKA